MLHQLPGYTTIDKHEIDDWCEADRDIPALADMTDDEIVSSLTNITNTPPTSDDESEDEMPDIKVPTHSEAIQYLEQSLYLSGSSKNDADPMDISIASATRTSG